MSFEERIACREVLNASGSWRFVGFLESFVRLGLDSVLEGSEISESSSSSEDFSESELEAAESVMLLDCLSFLCEVGGGDV